MKRSLQAGAPAAGLPEALEQLREEIEEIEGVLSDRIDNPGRQPQPTRGPAKA
jgi:hypothetical protein